ncbi:MAG: MoaD/ThiS family protein [Ginsengibacter sp.]
MTIKVFGQLVDIIGSTTFEMNDAVDTDGLVKILESKYPVLITSKYKIAVSRNLIQSNTALQQDAEVALLPPFSGG